ncbi:restriction endonuclease [Methylocaldum sp. 14B]|uniref:restriction endonuclease n=1 Tax=Methylocaldum sp. 14B TaxID=1912213 RepID=UPI00098A71E0|nr:restriction endonuclease [Methylocaldum sp. 14B]
MARRRRTSALEDVIDLAAMLPWWLALLLAIVSYFAIHHYAVMEVPAPMVPGRIGDAVGKQLTKTFALFGQYIVPFCFSLGALISIIGRRKRANLHEVVARQPAADALNGMSWREFEMLVGEFFRRQGYAVTETGGIADGGVDLVLTRGGETYLVQCKQWRAFKVSVNIVRELYGVMAARGAVGGFIVTSGVFTDDARQFASGRNIELIDGEKLFAMIKDLRRADAHPRTTTLSIDLSEPSSPLAEVSSTPMCPKCGASMRLRTARKGANAGQSFWGCSQFPNCRGVRPNAA